MKFYFHELAEKEFENAVVFYEDCRRGLGREFAQEVYATIERIVQYPGAGSSLSKNTRRCLVNRFPFGVIYQIKSEYLRIIAVADLRRLPNYWLNRA